MTDHPRIPRATYRLQFHSEFTFRDAKAILDYLNNLGISDVYASPYFQAGHASKHGYDIANHNRLNPAVGSASDYSDFVSALRERKMGQVLDFVPNHMGINEPINRWWVDVLEDGILSEYARYFDIDWFPAKRALAEKLVLPMLGDRYGKILESGEFKLFFERGAFYLGLYDSRLPISPRTYPFILRRVLELLEGNLRVEVEEISKQFEEYIESKDKIKKRLEELSDHEQRLRKAIDEVLSDLMGKSGNPESFRALHELLEEQVYRLSYWRVASDEINYRRFFDINTLAAIRVEIPEVFEAAHQFVFELLSRGDVTGLRIDHVDGLWNPREYLERLQQRYAELCGLRDNARGLYLIVEKILDSDECIPSDWPIHGTTGYEFANQLVHLFVDASSETALTRTYARYFEDQTKFADLVYEKKLLVMDRSFHGEIAALGRLLDQLSEQYWHYRDLTRNTLTSVVRETIACYPVYRSYASDKHIPEGQEERHILHAIAMARRRNPSVDKSAFEFLRDLLLLKFPENLDDKQKRKSLDFVMKFQQCTGPVMAKGSEDTALYLFNRLVALNEVGGNPGKFGLKIAEFHRLNQDRRLHTPYTLLATSTHDTKRSEDVRMRIAALSEIPSRWSKAVTSWTRWNRKFRKEIGGEFAPSRNEEYLLYQTLIGTWPLELLDESERRIYMERIQQYMLKTIKEGKVNSSWIEPNEEWELATSSFVEKILDENHNAPFVEDLNQIASDAAYLGALNSLAQTVLKCTVPGVPDFYQGTELWDFSLVDPDNRRPVDYLVRRQRLDSVKKADPVALLKDWKNSGIKLFVIQRLLNYRRENEEFFREADYVPLETTGTFADQVVAFSRSLGNQRILVAVTRCAGKVGIPPLSEIWKDTFILSGNASWRNVFTDKTFVFSGALKELFSDLPFAVLHRTEK